jgi:hypothetical protein
VGFGSSLDHFPSPHFFLSCYIQCTRRRADQKDASSGDRASVRRGASVCSVRSGGSSSVVVRGRNRRRRGLPLGGNGISIGRVLLCLRIPSIDCPLLRRQSPFVSKVERPHSARGRGSPYRTPPLTRTTAAEGDLKNPSSAKSASAEVSGLAPSYYLHITPDQLDQFLVLPALLVQCS